MPDEQTYMERHRTHLEKHHPQMVADLKAQGNWESHLEEVAQIAGEMNDLIYHQYLDKNPVPKDDPSDPFAQGNHLRQAAKVAEEFVMTDVVLQPLPSEYQESAV